MADSPRTKLMLQRTSRTLDRDVLVRTVGALRIQSVFVVESNETIVERLLAEYERQLRGAMSEELRRRRRLLSLVASSRK